jgi:hemolysin activation/secretion protein
MFDFRQWTGARCRSGICIAALILCWPWSHLWAQETTAPTPPPSDKILISNFRFQGNTKFSDAELAAELAPYRNQPLTSTDLEAARQKLTQKYIQAGYINSGALLASQTVTNQELTFTIVEGHLSEINVEGTKWLRRSYLRNRLALRAGPPLNVGQLQEAVRLLKENPNIEQINAELKPGGLPGEARLDVAVKEALPFHLGLQFRNDRPPSVGAEVLEVLASDTDVTGNSDVLDVRYGIAERTKNSADFTGLDNIGGAYLIPITRFDTTLQVYYNRNNYGVIEEPFDTLDMTSKSSTYGIALRQPIYRTWQREIALGLVGERRSTETFLDGEPFTFSPGAVDGETVVSALRFYQEWIERRANAVLALRSTFSLGLDVLDATDDGSNRDGQFFSWIGQGQYLQRLGKTAHQFLASAWVQWANDPLLSPEQVGIGGAHTVRGYRENQIVRDMAVIGSLEVQLALVTGKAGEPILQLCPFFDYGIGWNAETTPPHSDLMSAGLGVIYHPCKHFDGRVYWGYGFRQTDTNDDLQDYGIHFALHASFL